MEDKSSQQLVDVSIGIGKNFVQQYAHRLTSDPELAMIEIVSNSWDAGSNNVNIQWPDDLGGVFTIADDGIGMTYEHFISVWKQLSYSRPDKGKYVSFPSGNRQSSRKVFGRNGKGRFSFFCFADEYTIESTKDGKKFRCRIVRDNDSNGLFSIFLESREDSIGHGTSISCRATYNYIDVKQLKEVIGAKFIADPAFDISVNDDLVSLMDLNRLTEKQVLDLNSYGKVTVFELDSQKITRSSQQNGVAWWVNNKAVGKQGWRDPYKQSYLDARISIAKRYSYVVIADILEDYVEFDWTGFVESPVVEHVVDKVNEHIQDRLNTLQYMQRQERTRYVLNKERERLKKMATPTRQRTREFADELQKETRKPLNDQQLGQAVSIFITMEEARLGYRLLEQLSQFNTDDVNGLSEILEKWTVREAQIVLEELHRRIKLIEELEKVVEADSDELHVIHPLFEKGLWMFGPEFEDISYRSNNSLSTVIYKFFGDTTAQINNPRTRPDLVVLPDGVIQPFVANRFSEKGEPLGIGNVLIVELKRGNSKITFENKSQAEQYARAISKSQKVLKNARIVVYVLGTTVGDIEHEYKAGETTFIFPRAYTSIISMAKARTFHLKEQIENVRSDAVKDTDVEDIILAELKNNELD